MTKEILERVVLPILNITTRIVKSNDSMNLIVSVKDNIELIKKIAEEKLKFEEEHEDDDYDDEAEFLVWRILNFYQILDKKYKMFLYF